MYLFVILTKNDIISETSSSFARALPVAKYGAHIYHPPSSPHTHFPKF